MVGQLLLICSDFIHQWQTLYVVGLLEVLVRYNFVAVLYFLNRHHFDFLLILLHSLQSYHLIIYAL
jgi:hypothetical protein